MAQGGARHRADGLPDTGPIVGAYDGRITSGISGSTPLARRWPASTAHCDQPCRPARACHPLYRVTAFDPWLASALVTGARGRRRRPSSRRPDAASIAVTQAAVTYAHVSSLQAAVRQARPCDWILVAPGIYSGPVTITTTGPAHQRGLDRRRVLVGAATSSSWANRDHGRRRRRLGARTLDRSPARSRSSTTTTPADQVRRLVGTTGPGGI